jgi:pseudouridine-5'-phosphate glycosidase
VPYTVCWCWALLPTFWSLPYGEDRQTNILIKKLKIVVPVVKNKQTLGLENTRVVKEDLPEEVTLSLDIKFIKKLA